MSRRRTALLWLCVVGMLFAGCAASVPLTPADLDVEAKRFTPPSGRSNIYVFRGGAFGGSAIAFQIIVDGKVIGSIAPGTYHLIVVEPGDHSIAATSQENSKLVRLRAEPGRNYFFEVHAKMGMRSARVDLEVSDDTKGREGVAGSKRAESL